MGLFKFPKSEHARRISDNGPLSLESSERCEKWGRTVRKPEKKKGGE